MNILYSVFTNGWGGLEKYPLTLFETLKKKNNNVYIITCKNSKLFQAACDLGIETFSCDKFKKIDFKLVKKIREILREKKIDVVHLNSSRELYNWRLALIGFPHVKLVMTFHIGVPNHMELLHKFLYARVDKIIAISDFEMQEMFERLPVPKDKITYVRNGVDLSKFQTKNFKQSKTRIQDSTDTIDEINTHHSQGEYSIREKFGISHSDLLFTSIGNLSLGKGILEWIKATIEVCKTRENISFLWIGDDSHIDEAYTMEDLKKEIQDSGFEKRIILAGYQTEIPKFLGASDLFLLPARKESFGLVYIEAMAMGLPVIGCNAGGAKEIIKDGVNGYLCEVNNPVDLAKTILKAADNIRELKKIGEKNIEYVKQFAMEIHVDRLLEIYNSDK